MAAAKTRTFELTAFIQADTTADNTELDLTDYIDLADGEVFLLEEWSITLDPTEAHPGLTAGAAVVATFQIADTNINTYVSNNERTSLGTGMLMYPADGSFDQQISMSSDSNYGENLIVSRSIWVRNKVNTGAALDHTLVMRGRIVKPSAKDYMALILTQTGQVAV